MWRRDRASLRPLQFACLCGSPSAPDADNYPTETKAAATAGQPEALRSPRCMRCGVGCLPLRKSGCFLRIIPRLSQLPWLAALPSACRSIARLLASPVYATREYEDL